MARLVGSDVVRFLPGPACSVRSMPFFEDPVRSQEERR